MAELTVSKAVADNGTVTVTGTGFTKTTTKFYVDGEDTPFEVVSDTEVTLQSTTGTELYAEKGEVSTSPVTIKSDAPSTDESTEGSQQESSETPEASGPGVNQPSTTEHGEDDLSDVNQAELNAAASEGAADKPAPLPEPNREPLAEGEHLPADDFRFRVENTAAGDLNMDPREPYPTGNPPDPREVYKRIHGRYPKDDAEADRPNQASEIEEA